MKMIKLCEEAAASLHSFLISDEVHLTVNNVTYFQLPLKEACGLLKEYDKILATKTILNVNMLHLDWKLRCVNECPIYYEVGIVV